MNKGDKGGTGEKVEKKKSKKHKKKKDSDSDSSSSSDDSSSSEEEDTKKKQKKKAGLESVPKASRHIDEKNAQAPPKKQEDLMDLLGGDTISTPVTNTVSSGFAFIQPS